MAFADARSAVVDSVGRASDSTVRVLVSMGQQVAFYGRAVAWAPKTLTRYRREVMRLLAEVSLGTGALALIGGTVVIVAFLTAATGVEVGLQGYSSLGNIGVSALSGFVAAYVNTREAAPAIAGIGLTATVGAGFTAQLGAMRVAEEIDALETMAVPSVPYLVTTRIVAGLMAVIPLYAIAVVMSYVSTQFIITVIFGQSSGNYTHYFTTFLIPLDILWSFIKAILMAVAVISICCYYGYTASGGPAGVGTAVGRAVRASLIAVMMIDLLFGLAVWGGPPTVHIAS